MECLQWNQTYLLELLNKTCEGSIDLDCVMGQESITAKAITHG